jgi:glycosyltransferase involved in cell wall biosynthesis
MLARPSDPASSRSLRYALVTAARDEAPHIGRTIRAVTAQTVPPRAWAIVSDGSTDGTDDVVRSGAQQHSWIRLLRLERTVAARSFAAKAHAVNAGFDSLALLDFDLVGNLDADITVPPDYYEFLVQRFAEIPDLGVAGTPFVDVGEPPTSHSYRRWFANLDHVSGACQLFRRSAFEQIGGYTPVASGGIDWVAVTRARMSGWTTRTFVERLCTHHRPMGTADRTRLRARFRHGREDYLVGTHPLWEAAHGIVQMTRRPRVVGGLSVMLGYLSAWLSGTPSPVPQDLRDFHRREQMHRLGSFVHHAPRGILPILRR